MTSATCSWRISFGGQLVIDRGNGGLNIREQPEKAGLDKSILVDFSAGRLDRQPVEQGAASIDQDTAQGKQFRAAHDHGLASPRAISATDAAPRHCAP